MGNNCPSGGTDPRCTSTLPVLLPGLTITKAADTTFVVPGGTAGYTITVPTPARPRTPAPRSPTPSSVCSTTPTYDGSRRRAPGAVSYTAPDADLDR